MNREDLGAYLRQLRKDFLAQNEKDEGEFTAKEYAEENELTENVARKDLEKLFKAGKLDRRMVTSPCKTYYYKEKK